MLRLGFALLLAAAVPFTHAQNETTEDAVALLFPDYCVSSVDRILPLGCHALCSLGTMCPASAYPFEWLIKR